MLTAGQTINRGFIVRSAFKERSFADSDPVLTVIRNGIDTSIPVNVVQNTNTGEYRFAFDIPTDWIEGDSVDVRFDYSVNTLVESTIAHLGYIDIDSDSLSEKVWDVCI